MDLLFTTHRTPQSRLVRDCTGSYWTHISGIVNGNVYDFNYKQKRVQDLHEYCWGTAPVDVDIKRGVPLDEQEFLDLFENAKYESLKGLYRIIQKHSQGRDKKDVSTSPEHFTCASLIGKLIQKKYHCSQAIPDDFYPKKLYLSNKN